MEKSISYKGQNLYYQELGKGEAIVLLHGFGEDASIWNELADKLSKEFRLIIPDLPGSGRSETIGAGTKHDHLSIDQHSEAVNEILIQEGIAECVMIGHSMGGYITLAFAEKFPEKLKGFGLFHSSAFADNEEKIETRLKAIEFINQNGAEAFLKTAIPNLFAEKFKSASPEIVEQTVSRYDYFSKEALTGYYHAMIERPDRTEILRKSKVAVMFIIGEEDNAIPFESSKKQCHLPSESHILILEKTGHMGMIEAY